MVAQFLFACSQFIQYYGKLCSKLVGLGFLFLPFQPAPTKSKRVRISVPEAVDSSNPRLGIQIIAYLLNRYGTRKYLLSAHIEQLRELESELQELWVSHIHF